jgi:hypothetical protein
MLAPIPLAEGGPGDDVMVVANLHAEPREGYRVGFPREGLWKLRLSTGWSGYRVSRRKPLRATGCAGLPRSHRTLYGLVFSQDQ